MQTSYKNIFEIMLERVLLLILEMPFSFMLLKTPVIVSSIIAHPTAIKSPCIGTNSNNKDDNM